MISFKPVRASYLSGYCGSFFVALLSMALYCCGGDPPQKRGEDDGIEQESKKACEQLSRKSLECVDVLVPIVEKSSHRLLESAVRRVDQSEQHKFRERVEKSMDKQKEKMKDILGESLKKPFMNWCLRAAGDPKEKEIFDSAVRCLKSPDCQTYGLCLEKIILLDQTVENRP